MIDRTFSMVGVLFLSSFFSLFWIFLQWPGQSSQFHQDIGKIRLIRNLQFSFHDFVDCDYDH